MPDRTEEAVAHGADKKDEFSFPPRSLSLSMPLGAVAVERRRGVSRGRERERRRRRGISVCSGGRGRKGGREEWRERGGASGVGQERV